MDDRFCWLSIVNVLKHFLLETLSVSILKQYRAEVVTLISHNIGEPDYNNPAESLNDDDVDHFFGWASMKLKIKYKKGNLSSNNMKIV